MTENEQFSRSRREEKRRNSKRKFIFFASLAVIFGIFLSSLIFFGNKEEPAKETSSKTTSEVESQTENKTEDQTEKPADADSTESKNDDANSNDPVEQTDVEDRVEVMEKEKESESEVETEEVQSDDSNVTKAYTGNWQPVGTEQSGPHTTNYDDGSQDRTEIKKAVSMATGVPEDHIIEHWIGNGGEQKVEATIQDETTSASYRVYLEWNDGGGWQPTKVEELSSWNG